MIHLLFSKIFFAFYFLLMLVSSTPAYGTGLPQHSIVVTGKAAVLYIDPGTGSLLFQILSAIILAILFYLSLIRKTLGRLFGKVKKIFLNQKIDT